MVSNFRGGLREFSKELSVTHVSTNLEEAVSLSQSNHLRALEGTTMLWPKGKRSFLSNRSYFNVPPGGLQSMGSLRVGHD